jgi:cholesterol oxidase
MGESRDHVDVAVVGSGFGGSVSAYRFAEAGRSVAVLERGRPYPPGSFPHGPTGLAENMWDPSEGLHGLFDVWSFRGLDALVSSGLGGGSLIYANVLLRKDEKWFVHEQGLPGGGFENWPVTRADLEPHYDAAERMLRPQRYPFAVAPYDRTPKTRALNDAAQRLGLGWSLPPLAVSFAPEPGGRPVPGAPIPEPDYGNLHGLPRRTCRLCGECDIGCNDGAKNTLDHTYLSAAKHHGADIRTRTEVRGIRPLDGGGYEVRYVVHEPTAGKRRHRTARLPEHVLTCGRLVLAAGTLGTTWLLLRNRASLPGLSPALGTRFSGNGDLLGFVLRAHDDDGAHRTLGGSYGPVITSTIRVPDSVDGIPGAGRGFYIQDAGYPGFADWLVESSQWPGYLRRGVVYAIQRLKALVSRSPKTSVSAELSALLGRSELSDGSLPLLGMGRDIPDGVLRIRGGRLDVDWTTETSEAYFAGVRSTMQDIAAVLHGDFRQNPLDLLRKVITVHPLGGAPMGRHPAEGVVDAWGEVFGFPGLYVADGAAVPGPVGANPSLTIAALADRLCDHALSTASPAGRRDTAPPATPGPAVLTGNGRRTDGRRTDGTALSFTEEMKGFAAIDVEDPLVGAERGRADGDRLMFHLTITMDDVDRFVADAEREARAEGWVECDLLGGRLPVVEGWFNLFTRDTGPGGRSMHYRLHFTDGAGAPLTLVGRKDVRDDAGPDLWRDTSTLFTRVLEGWVPPGQEGDARVVAAGVLTIPVPDFLQQLTTFRATGGQPVEAVAQFGRLFLGELWDVYSARLGGGSRP